MNPDNGKIGTFASLEEARNAGYTVPLTITRDHQSGRVVRIASAAAALGATVGAGVAGIAGAVRRRPRTPEAYPGQRQRFRVGAWTPEALDLPVTRQQRRMVERAEARELEREAAAGAREACRAAADDARRGTLEHAHRKIDGAKDASEFAG